MEGPALKSIRVSSWYLAVPWGRARGAWVGAGRQCIATWDGQEIKDTALDRECQGLVFSDLLCKLLPSPMPQFPLFRLVRWLWQMTHLQGPYSLGILNLQVLQGPLSLCPKSTYTLG